MDEIVLNSNKMTLSDSEFHWKFMNKYGKYGQQRSIFPTLFFYRITGTGKSVFRKEITFQTTFNKIQLKINFHEQNINSAPIFQNIRYYKNIIHNVLLNYSPIEEKLISTTSTRSNTGGNISKAPLVNFNKVKSGNENSTSFLPVTNYFFNSHFLDNTLLNTSVSIPKSTPYFLEKSVIFGSIKKSSFMNLLWNPSTRILNNYPLNLHVLNKRLFSPDSSFNTYSRKSKPAFGKLLKLISSVHPRFLNNYPILIDSSRKADFECLKTLKSITLKVPEAENLLPDTFSKLALYSNWTYFSSHLKNLHGKGLKIPKSLWIPDFNYKNSKLSHHLLTVDFPVKLDSHKKLNQPKIGLLDAFSLESKNSASTKILARIFQMNAEYNSGHLLMETFLRCKTSFSGQKAPLIKIRNIDNEGLPDIDHPSEIAYFNCFLNIHDIYAQDCNINSPVNPGSILRNFPKICYSENSSSLNTLLNPRSYNVNPVFRRFRKPSPGIHTELAKYIFGKGYSGETFKSENYSSSKRGSSIKYIFKIPSYKKYSAFIRNWLNSISLKNLIKLRANFHGIQASKKPGYFIETSFKADHLKKLIYNEYISTLIPFKQSSLFSRYFIGLVYLKKDLFNAITSEDSSDGSFFVKNLHNSEKNPSLFNSYLFNYHYSKNLGQVFRKSLKTILQKSPNFANVFDIDSFDIDSSRYLANGNYFRHFPESLKRTSIFQNNIWFRHLVKKIESNPEQRKAPSPGKEVHNTGKVREIYSYAAKKLLSPGFLHVFQAGLRYENTKLLKMKISISRNRNLTNIIDDFLEGYFQNKRNKLSFIGNPYSKKIFMDNPRDSKAKLPSFLSSFRYSTNNYSTKNMIPLKRKNHLLKTGPLYKISQIIASRNCNLILKHQAISGEGDSNLMFIMTKCKADNFFLESGELFGFKSADGIDYFQSENNLPVGNENLVYRSQENEITQSIAEEVQKIKKVVFDTREAIVVNSSKDTFLNNTNLKQKIDIEYISEKVSQLIGHKMKIEAERRGIL